MCLNFNTTKAWSAVGSIRRGGLERCPIALAHASCAACCSVDPYRALAQLAYASSQKGDNATAGTLARILERTWDKSEDYGGDTALSKTNHALFDEIDKAMDQFVNLLIEHRIPRPTRPN